MDFMLSLCRVYVDYSISILHRDRL